jgi:hypothetical protein
VAVIPARGYYDFLFRHIFGSSTLVMGRPVQSSPSYSENAPR